MFFFFFSDDCKRKAESRQTSNAFYEWILTTVPVAFAWMEANSALEEQASILETYSMLRYVFTVIQRKQHIALANATQFPLQTTLLDLPLV